MLGFRRNLDFSLPPLKEKNILVRFYSCVIMSNVQNCMITAPEEVNKRASATCAKEGWSVSFRLGSLVCTVKKCVI